MLDQTSPDGTKRWQTMGESIRNPRGWPMGVKVLAGLFLFLFLLWLILFVTKGRFLKGTFERIASSSLEREVTVTGDFWLYFDPFDVRFRAEGLRIAGPEWSTAPHFFKSALIDSRLSTLRLLVGKQRFNVLTLDRGDVRFEWDKAGKRNSWTFGDPSAPGEPLDLPEIRKAALTNTVLHYNDPPAQLSAEVRFNTIQAADTRVQEDIRFNGTGQMRGTDFTLTGGLLSPNATLAGGQNKFVLDATAGDTRLHADGTLPGLTIIEGAKLNVSARGRNIANLFQLIGVAVPDTRRYALTSRMTKVGDEYRFEQLKGSFGDSDLAGRLTIASGDRLKLTADLKSEKVDIIDIGPFVGYNPDRLAAQGRKGTIRQEGGSPRVLPDATLRIEALDNFDADVKYAVKQIRAPDVPISNLQLVLDLEKRLLKLSPLNFQMSGGNVSSDIIIDARQQPVVTQYDIRLAPTPMGRLLAGWGVSESGTSGTIKARIQLTGRGNTVHDSLATSNGRMVAILPRGSLWTSNIQLSELDVGTFATKMFSDKLKEPVSINCGVIAFTVRNGVAAADPILIDTSKNVITGRGGFRFRDESLDLAFRADGKTFSLFSGQSPVGLQGRFAEPALQVISPELLTRAGVAVGIAAVAAPVAAVLAFVDVGDAKSADCGPVLSGARATAQRTSKGKAREDVGKGRPDKD